MVDEAEGGDLPNRIERLLTGTGNEQVHRLLAQLRGDMDELRTTVTAQLAPVEEHMRAVAALVSDRDPAQRERFVEQISDQMTQVQAELAGQRQDIAQRIGAIGDALRSLPADAPAPVLDPEAVREVVRAEIGTLASQIRNEIAGVLAAHEPPARDDRSFEDLAAGLAEVGSRLASHREDVGSRIESLEGAVRAVVRAEIDSLSSGVRSDVVDALGLLEQAGAPDLQPLARAIAELRARFDERQEDLAVTVGGLESAVRSTQEASPAPFDTIELRSMLREEVESLGVGIRTDVDVALRARDQHDSQAVDGLALRITNLSMSVSQALDGVRGQVQSMTDRAERLEAEHAAVLEAVRSEIAGISIGSSADNADGGSRIAEHLEGFASRLDDVSTQVLARVASLEQTVRSSAPQDPAQELEGIEQRLRALPQIAEQLATLAALPEQIQALASIHNEVRDIAASTSPIGMLPRIEETLARLEQSMNAIASAPAPADPIERLGAPLEEIRERLADLSAIKAAVESLPDPSAAAERYASSLGEHLASVRHQLGAQIDGLRMDSGERLTELETRLQATLREEAVSPALEEGLAAIVASAEGNAGRIEQLLAGAGSQADALRQLSVRLDGLETAVARALIEARTAFDGATAESNAVLERVGGEFASLADHVRALGDTSASVREQLDTLPGPADIAKVVAADVAAEVEPIVTDLEAAATNVAEIWMRLRTMDATMAEFAALTGKQLRSTLARVESGTRRMEDIASSESRLAARIADVENRVVGATKAIEAERDRIFVEALTLLAERLARKDRTIGKRLRSVIGRSKHSAEQLDDVIEPVASLANRVARPAIDPSAGSPALEPPRAAPAQKRKRAPKPSATQKKAKSKTTASPRHRNESRAKASAKAKEPERTSKGASVTKKKDEARSTEGSAKRSARTQGTATRRAATTRNGAPASLEAAIDAALGDPGAETPVGGEGAER